MNGLFSLFMNNFFDLFYQNLTDSTLAIILNVIVIRNMDNVF